MLEHVECPRCSAPNLTTEAVCFACGTSLRPSRKRARGGPPAEVPWPFWLALIAAVLAAGLVAWHLAAWIAGFRARSDLAPWHLPAAGAVLVAAGQAAFYQARRRDRRWWRLRRAPELKLSRASVGDALWAHGELACDTPLTAPYTSQECAYYRYEVRERESDEAGWRVTERGTKAVDFRLVQNGESVYVPCGSVLFDAPFYGDKYIDSTGITRVRVWAFPVGGPVSVCGVLVGETSRPRVDALDASLPIVATWRLPGDYVRLVARRARAAYLWGWALTMVGVLVLIAGIVGV
jgi:hypothetical protein